MSEHDDEQLWAAVADPSRRRIIDAMLLLGETSQTALAEQVPFTRQAVAKHLGVLEEVDLVTRSKHGREVLYNLDLDRLELAAHAMSRIVGNWNRRMNAIKHLAESIHEQQSTSRRETVR
jgi:DNA-binding transcriptional ArsR family regulator